MPTVNFNSNYSTMADENDPAAAADTAGDVVDFSQQVDDDFAHAYGMMPGIGGIGGPMRRLRNQFRKVGKTFDMTQTLKEGNAAREYGKDVAVGGANTAAQAYMAGSGGDNAAGAAVIRARLMQPAMKSDADTALQLAQMRDTAARDALKMKVDIASTMGSLKNQYLSTLASYNSSRAQNARSMMAANDAARAAEEAKRLAAQQHTGVGMTGS